MPQATNSSVAKPSRIRLFTLAAFTSGLLLGSAALHTVHGQEQNAAPAQLTVLSPQNLSTAFSKIAAQVGPAVVNINTTILPKADRKAQGEDGDDQGGNPQDPQDFFRRFFGGPGGPGQGPEQQEQRALGSGFIVDPHGYIVTNNHVIDKADRIYVKLATDPENSQGHPAKLVGTDPETDLAVIKIDVGHPLPTVKLDNSDSAAVGSWVEAIGSPFDLSQTVTTGIVSARNRSVQGPIGGQFKHYIQTDAAINPGNSGGPLLDMDGQVVGVNTAIATESNGSAGIGFAIPSNTVAEVYNQLVGSEHKVVRGSIGIRFQPGISPAVAKLYHADTGVLVTSVTPGQPADKAGLKQNDVITSIDGKPVKDGDALVADISERHPGSTVKLGYLRDGKQETTTCSIGDRANLTQVAANEGTPNAPSGNPGKAKLGLSVQDLPEDAPRGLHGVLVRGVTPGSFADELSPQVVPGLIIDQVNRKPVANKADFDAIVNGLKPGDTVVFEVRSPNGGQAALTGGTLS